MRSLLCCCTFSHVKASLHACAPGSVVLLWSLVLFGLVFVVPRVVQLGLMGVERTLVGTLLSFEQVVVAALLSAAKMVRPLPSAAGQAAAHSN